MTAIDSYLRELDGALHVRGRARQRLLAETRDHLMDAGSAEGADEAIRQFGSAHELARSFDAEIAVRRALRATVLSVAGVFAVAFSALSVVQAAASHGSVIAWVVVFFGAAQVSAVATALALLRAAAMRYEATDSADVALLCRRNLVALASAALTLFAAGAAVTGNTSAWRILLGPVVALLALGALVRTRSLARTSGMWSPRGVRAPLTDLRRALRRAADLRSPASDPDSLVLLGPTVVIAAIAAFVWDHQDQGTTTSSIAAAGIEIALTLAGFFLLGPALGLRAGSRRRRGVPT